MRALHLTEYGSPENLAITEMPKPVAGDGKVLVRVHATSVNDWDWKMILGKPFYMRMLCGLLRPKIGIPGVDVAGVVEEVGPGVTAFKPGDKVYGDLSENGFGAFAEYVAPPVEALANMPDGMNFIDAAALPHASLLAWQALAMAGPWQPESRLLVNGAGGGVGTLVVQMARHWGITDITGVDHPTKFGAMQQTGYSDCIDYTNTDFTRVSDEWDVVLDTRTNRPATAYLRALKPGGRYVTVGGQMRHFLPMLLAAPLIKARTGKHLMILPLQPNKGLDEIDALYDQGNLVPVIDGPYAFDDLPQAIARFGAARHIGKLVITLD